VIYFVQPEGRPLVKIGYARCVRSRLADLQTYSPDKLVLLGVVAGGPARETALHARFAHLRVRGEWFRLTREVRRFLEAEGEDYQPHRHDPAVNGTPADREWFDSLARERVARVERVRRRVCVWVQEFPDRDNLVLQWHDPDTGKRRSKTTGTSNRDEAEVLRSDLEAVLNFRIRNTSRNSAAEAIAGNTESDATSYCPEGG
jgi:hypothetical protein